ncbi:MAG: C_GCAxxG_C_C family protein, partial [Flavobacteriales bacterium]|nr:C_GCAxxG_C_C family protein [Flavobacteriales bacterium]
TAEGIFGIRSIGGPADMTLDNTIDIWASTHAVKAMALFKEGYNCSQAVCLAFADVYSEKYAIEESTILKLSSSFGGGMGRLREVCGAVTGVRSMMIRATLALARRALRYLRILLSSAILSP